MSCLRLYWPQRLSLYSPPETECDDRPSEASGDEPVILSFPRLESRVRGSGTLNLLARSRLIHQNRCCPDCGRASVELIESERLLMNYDQMPIPGTGTLVGFRCGSCGNEWDA